MTPLPRIRLHRIVHHVFYCPDPPVRASTRRIHPFGGRIPARLHVNRSEAPPRMRSATDQRPHRRTADGSSVSVQSLGLSYATSTASRASRRRQATRCDQPRNVIVGLALHFRAATASPWSTRVPRKSAAQLLNQRLEFVKLLIRQRKGVSPTWECLPSAASHPAVARLFCPDTRSGRRTPAT